ncbi:sigma-54-dependent transcriptional regulator [Aliivibrio kagoshimensis]|uniref:sigma-54-dependent transcriptional regulator n=1 Tax=Aliivibrio kagoshimensis TaxID=2910230 RepID=UPI003D0EEE3B
MAKMIGKSILMVEDTISVAALYRSYLNPLGYDVEIVITGKLALEQIQYCKPDLILLDLHLPDMPGMDVLHEVRVIHPDIPIILMTAHGSIDSAVEAMRFGAQDFLLKPCSADKLRITVQNALHQANKKSMGHERDVLQNRSHQGFIGSSLLMQKVYRVIDSAASSKATVFITGESGTGKEVCAEAVHARSRRGDKDFIAINCAAIPTDLIESELFGHIKGAFSGSVADRQGAAELADGGTLFLDEICEMSLEVQKKLLRFIQTGTFQKVGSSEMKRVDVRFICATNRDPWKEVEGGRFREDLYYRLHVIPLAMPPLRERGDDVIEIGHSILGHMSKEEGRDFITFSREVTTRFEEYDWPGNVRQLQNVIRNIVVLNKGKEVTVAMLPAPLNVEPVAVEPEASKLPMQNTKPKKELDKISIEDTVAIEPLWVAERRIIEIAIEACDGNIIKAASFLEVSPSTIYRKIQRWSE